MGDFLLKCGKFFSWFYLIFTGIIFPLILLGWGIYELVTNKNVTNGTISNIGNCSSVPSNNYKMNCPNLQVDYTVDGTKYNNITPTNSDYVSNNLRLGSSVYVHYNPDNPEKCSVHMEGNKLKGILLIVGAVLLSAFGIGVWYGVQHSEIMAKIFCLSSLIRR